MSILDSLLETIIHQHYLVTPCLFFSEYLDRQVRLDLYQPQQKIAGPLPLLLVNDGQDLPKMPFAGMLDNLTNHGEITPIIAVGIYCNEDRKLEYGTADEPDYLNRGSRAKYHRKFVVKELLPFIQEHFKLANLSDVAYAGFSLGGLSALDIVWKHPAIFNRAAVFSGSLWWRSKALDDGYVEETDRIMHKLIRLGTYAPNLSFYFQTGQLDEIMDRNNNGIIDSIDDTLDLIKALEQKGYQNGNEIRYLEMPLGKHDVPTWAGAFPDFLRWSYGK